MRWNGKGHPAFGLSRRHLLAAFAAVGLGGAGSGQKEATLAEIARAAGLRFGSAVRAASLDNPALMGLLARQCDTLTPELELKWGHMEPLHGTFQTGGADRLARFARTHGLRLRGHTLLWDESTPSWFGPSTSWDAVADHIHRTVTRYGPLVDEWDVVNEPIVAGGLRHGPLFDAFGPSYIAKALDAARDAAPDARLFLNEYDCEYPIPEQAARRTSLISLASNLVAQGTPLDGIGIQAHLAIERGPIDARVLRDFFDRITDLGLSIAITELDVKERDYILPAFERDRAVADHVARFLEIALDYPQVRSLTCWGLSDAQSWLAVKEEDFARFPDAWQDGSHPGLNRGLPYNASLRPKPMRGAVADAMRQRNLRRN